MQLTTVTEMQFNITIFGPCTLQKMNNLVILSRKKKNDLSHIDEADPQYYLRDIQSFLNMKETAGLAFLSQLAISSYSCY